MGDFLLPDVSGWVEWSAIFTDESLWRPVIHRVWQEDEELRRASGVISPRTIAGGYPGTCAVFVIDDSAVIKFFPPMVARDYAREKAVYELISGRVPHLPALLDSGSWQDRIEWPFLVVSYLPGRAWRESRADIAPPETMKIMAELGRTIRALHDISLPTTGTWPAAAAWETFVAARLPQVGADLIGGTFLGGDVIDEIERQLALTDWLASGPCLLHADLTEDHLLVDHQDVALQLGHGSMTGLIDWADAEVGDPLYDWVALWFSICRRDVGLYRAFRDGYGPISGETHLMAERLTAMTFLHRFGANLVGEILSPEEQRAVGSYAELRSILSAGL